MITFGEALVAFTLLVSFLQIIPPIAVFRINVKDKNGVQDLVRRVCVAIFLIFISEINLISFAKNMFQFYEVSLGDRLIQLVNPIHPLMYYINNLPFLKIMGCFLICKVFYDMIIIIKNPCLLNEENCKKYLDDVVMR